MTLTVLVRGRASGRVQSGHDPDSLAIFPLFLILKTCQKISQNILALPVWLNPYKTRIYKDFMQLILSTALFKS